ncbi:HD-GYP domain-containing protein, partial [Syntrophomonas wolfei]
MAEALDMSPSQISCIKLLAQYHDIGQVGISDAVLFKKGKLNSQERLQIERHPEIGYRIARLSPKLLPIADWILRHHEWWNGQGYPCGLAGEDIPLECRILALVDAYNAMTSNR